MLQEHLLVPITLIAFTGSSSHHMLALELTDTSSHVWKQLWDYPVSPETLYRVFKGLSFTCYVPDQLWLWQRFNSGTAAFPPFIL